MAAFDRSHGRKNSTLTFLETAGGVNSPGASGRRTHTAAGSWERRMLITASPEQAEAFRQALCSQTCTARCAYPQCLSATRRWVASQRRSRRWRASTFAATTSWPSSCWTMRSCETTPRWRCAAHLVGFHFEKRLKQNILEVSISPSNADARGEQWQHCCACGAAPTAQGSRCAPRCAGLGGVVP